eukprot:jgi/Ulvmu1/3231/UM015_0272.1
MPKKTARFQADGAQRTLFQCGSFTPTQDRRTSLSHNSDCPEPNRAQSGSMATQQPAYPMVKEDIDENLATGAFIRAAQPTLPETEVRLDESMTFQAIAQAHLQDPKLPSLNEEQKVAAAAPFNSPIAIFAGAGTGKTTTLIARIWRMLAQGIKPESILAITFTRKACQEIKERLMANSGCKVPVNVFTFHGWAVRFLRMKKVRELVEVPQKLVIWAQRDQKEHMAEACQRASVDHMLLPQACRVMELPATSHKSIHQRWKELLRKAFTDPDLREHMRIARDRAKTRVQAALKEVGTPHKDGTEDADDVEGIASRCFGNCMHHHTESAYSDPGQAEDQPEQQYGSQSGPAAAPGASTVPAARMKHVRAKARDLAQADASESDEEEREVGNGHLKSNDRPEGRHWVDELFPDGSVEAWTLVAKELLTTYVRQECGIEIIAERQDTGTGQICDDDKRTRIANFRQYFLYHRRPAAGAPAHTTELDKKLLTTKVSKMVGSIFHAMPIHWLCLLHHTNVCIFHCVWVVTG